MRTCTVAPDSKTMTETVVYFTAEGVPAMRTNYCAEGDGRTSAMGWGAGGPDPFLFRGGAARLTSLLVSRSGVVPTSLRAVARHHPKPLL
jgi:hypothetical protein